jgi:hypothetical protein
MYFLNILYGTHHAYLWLQTKDKHFEVLLNGN